MIKIKMNATLLLLAGTVMVLSIWGPELLTTYKDKDILNKIHVQEVDTTGEGYRYSMTRNEKLYILSEALNSQVLPESEQNFMTRKEAADVEYQQISGAYAFVVNHKGPSDKEISGDRIFEACNREIEVLKELGILPESVGEVKMEAYDAVLHSAIDVLEPRNNMAVWKLSLSSSQKNADRSNRMIDVCMDADDGKLYEIYVRTDLTWEDIDTDEIVNRWSEYLGLSEVVPYDMSNPLMETTPYFKKYACSGMGDGTTIITVGFYDGINELFIKISK